MGGLLTHESDAVSWALLVVKCYTSSGLQSTRLRHAKQGHFLKSVRPVPGKTYSGQVGKISLEPLRAIQRGFATGQIWAVNNKSAMQQGAVALQVLWAKLGRESLNLGISNGPLN